MGSGPDKNRIKKEREMCFKTLIVFFLALFAFYGGRLPGCTMIMAAKNGQVYSGNNEDHLDIASQVTFLPAAEGTLGCIFFGFRDGFPQGGMNERGLFIDGNAVASTGWKPQEGKPYNFVQVILKVLLTCATVEDARKVFEEHNVPSLLRARFPVSDASGASLVVEYAQGRVQFVREKEWFQVSTNFLRTDHPGNEVPCRRFRIARDFLAQEPQLSLAVIRRTLALTHSEGESPTVYSYICDQKRLRIHIYYYHDFDREIVLDLPGELAQGKRVQKLADLFQPVPFAALQFLENERQPAYPVLMDIYVREGAAAMLARYGQMRQAVRWISRYDIGPDDIMRLGREVMEKGDHETALAVFEKLSLSFPESWEACEGISRALLALKREEQAKASLRRLLELKPDHEWARKKLGEIR
jgi:hypothetical protein